MGEGRGKTGGREAVRGYVKSPDEDDRHLNCGGGQDDRRNI